MTDGSKQDPGDMLPEAGGALDEMSVDKESSMPANVQFLLQELDRARMKDAKAMACVDELHKALDKVVKENEDLVSDVKQLIGSCERTQKEKKQVSEELSALKKAYTKSEKHFNESKKLWKQEKKNLEKQLTLSEERVKEVEEQLSQLQRRARVSGNGGESRSTRRSKQRLEPSDETPPETSFRSQSELTCSTAPSSHLTPTDELRPLSPPTQDDFDFDLTVVQEELTMAVDKMKDRATLRASALAELAQEEDMVGEMPVILSPHHRPSPVRAASESSRTSASETSEDAKRRNGILRKSRKSSGKLKAEGGVLKKSISGPVLSAAVNAAAPIKKSKSRLLSLSRHSNKEEKKPSSSNLLLKRPSSRKSSMKNLVAASCHELSGMHSSKSSSRASSNSQGLLLRRPHGSSSGSKPSGNYTSGGANIFDSLVEQARQSFPFQHQQQHT
jgi:myosin heavy subunit